MHINGGQLFLAAGYLANEMNMNQVTRTFGNMRIDKRLSMEGFILFSSNVHIITYYFIED